MRDAYEKKILKQKVVSAVVIAWFIGGSPIIVVALWWVFQLSNISISEVAAWALGALIFGLYFWSILKLDGWAKSVGPTIAEQEQRDRRSAY
jgi:hypothetical protein